MTGDRWIGLFVVADSQDRVATPFQREPTVVLSLIGPVITDGTPVFDFSDYEQGLEGLVAWLRRDETGPYAVDVAQRSAPAAEDTDAAAGEIAPGFEPIEAIERFKMSREAASIMRYARRLAAFYIDGGQVLFDELLVFGAAESGTFNPNRTAGFLWRAMERAGGVEYLNALRKNFPEWDRDRGSADASVRQVSANTLDILAGAELIARRVSSDTSIGARHLVAALYVVRPSAPGAQTPADYASRRLAIPDIRETILDYVRSVVPDDDRAEWDAIVARTWTVAELAPPADPGTAAADEPAATRRAFGVRAASLSDSVATRDRLGFEPYVNAVAAFITNPETQAPLTLAVEGEWGSGKSSFMRQVEAAIREDPGGTKPAKMGGFHRILAALNPWHDPGPVTVWFNPWRHDREEALWAAFALEFLRNISRQLPFARRWRGHLKLLHTRFSWRDGWWDVARMVALIALAAATLVILLTVVFDPKFVKLFTLDLQSDKGKGLVGTLLKVGGTAGVVALAASLVKEVKSFVGNPFRVELKRFVRSPDYQGRISFIEQFHRDFGKMVEAYAGGRKVYVFIDDLDRCQVPRAADLMQALNLMIAEEQPLVFIIGMDREKIAASLAVKFKEVIPYLGGASSLAEDRPANAAAAAGLEYGSEFLEKFVQVSIRVPQPRESDITRLLEGLSTGGAASTAVTMEGAAAGAASGPSALRVEVTGSPAAVAISRVPASDGAGNTDGGRAHADPEARRAMRRNVAVDSPRLHDIVRLVAPALDYNPRRVKQFINACRLQAYIAIETGLIAEEETGAPSDLTFEKLGKFVAITLRWPLLATHLEDEPDLLQRLEAVALGTSSSVPRISHWTSRPRLMELMRAGLLDGQGQAPPAGDTYGFTGVDIAQLLRVTGGSPLAAVAAQSAEIAAARADPSVLSSTPA
jgi:hypothetical protein